MCVCKHCLGVCVSEFCEIIYIYIYIYVYVSVRRGDLIIRTRVYRKRKERKKEEAEEAEEEKKGG